MRAPEARVRALEGALLVWLLAAIGCGGPHDPPGAAADPAAGAASSPGAVAGGAIPGGAGPDADGLDGLNDEPSAARGAALSGGLFTGGLAPIETGPSPKPRPIGGGAGGADAASWGSADCARCHRAKGRQWASSQHAGAFDDPIFQVSWREWPNGWCVNCHLPRADDQRAVFGRTATPGGFLTPPGEAPRGYGPLGAAARRARDAETPGATSIEAAPDGPPPGDAGAPHETDGVGCPTCHVRGGEVLAPSAPSLRGRLAHPMREEPLLRTSDFCAGCHEFSFQRHTPAWPFSYSGEPLQATWAEWSGSAAAGEGRTCQSCHMPGGDHSAPGGHDPALVRGALSIEVARLGPGSVEATLTASGAAHRVPTGDPFRRLVLEICPGGLDGAAPDAGAAGCEAPSGRASFSRRFQPTDEAWAMFDDTTVPPAGDGDAASGRVEIALDGAARSWRLWYYFGDRRFHDMLEPAQVRYLVSEGALP